MQPIFFLHVPKTGGTSVVESLKGPLQAAQLIVIPERNVHGDYLSMEDKFAWVFDNRFKLREARFICGHYLYGIHEYLHVDPYYVTVFHDPLERMASQFRHVQASRSKDLPHHQEVRNMDFDEFTRKDWPRDSTRYHCAPNVYTYMISGGEPDDAGLNRATQILQRHFKMIGMLCRLKDFIHALGAEANLQLKAEKKGVNTEVPKFDIEIFTQNEFCRRNELDYQLYHFARSLSNA